MSSTSDKSEQRVIILIFLLAFLVFGSILWYARKSGALCLDDAYITFRYAENLALGRGMVFNPGERVLGTSTPFFCLLLAVLRFFGFSPVFSADLLNLFSAIFSSILIYLICREAKNRNLGLVASLLFISFPYFWINLSSGMETMFTIFLCLSLVWLDLKKRPMLAGVVGALLFLTRIDALALFAGVFSLRLFKSWRQAMMMGFTFLLSLLPWVAFAWFYFGSPIPHSLLAKKLIHPLPARLVLRKYLFWFLGLQEVGAEYKLLVPVLIGYSGFALIGMLRAFFKERWALVFILWLFFFLAGMTYGRVGPFPWYKVPMLSGYLILVGLGIQALNEFLPKGKGPLAQILSFFIIFLLLGGFLGGAREERFFNLTSKEKANLELSQKIKALAHPGDKILVGEVGVMGYELLDYYVIDSAGITSKEVYQIRRRDKEALRNKWDWWGSPEWVKEVLREYAPEFIASELQYLHLKSLSQEPEFKAQYQPIAVANFDRGAVVLFQRKKIQ